MRPTRSMPHPQSRFQQVEEPPQWGHLLFPRLSSLISRSACSRGVNRLFRWIRCCSNHTLESPGRTHWCVPAQRDQNRGAKPVTPSGAWTVAHLKLGLFLDAVPMNTPLSRLVCARFSSLLAAERVLTLHYIDSNQLHCWRPIRWPFHIPSQFSSTKWEY